MSTNDMERLPEVWREVRQWPSRTRLALASRILQSLEADDTVPPHDQRERRALTDLIGAWKTDQPSDDEAIERILDEERMRKHG